MSVLIRLPKREQTKVSDTWDLASLFATDVDWEKAFQKFEKRIAGYATFPGTLRNSAAAIAACLKFDTECSRLGERLGVYAFLKTTEESDEWCVPADVWSLSARGDSGKRSCEFSASRNSRNSNHPVEAISGESNFAALPIGTRETTEVQEAHTGETGGGTACHARLNGRSGRPRFSPVA